MEDSLRYAREVRGDRQTRPDVSAVLIYIVPRKYLTPKSDKNVIFEFDGNVESQRREEYKATVRYFRHVQKYGFLNDRQLRHLFPLTRIRIFFLIDPDQTILSHTLFPFTFLFLFSLHSFALLNFRTLASFN